MKNIIPIGKRFLILLSVLLFSVSFVGCNKTTDNIEEKTPEIVEIFAGTINKKVFTSKKFGVDVKVPKDWSIDAGEMGYDINVRNSNREDGFLLVVNKGYTVPESTDENISYHIRLSKEMLEGIRETLPLEDFYVDENFVMGEMQEWQTKDFKFIGFTYYEKEGDSKTSFVMEEGNEKEIYIYMLCKTKMESENETHETIQKMLDGFSRIEVVEETEEELNKRLGIEEEITPTETKNAA